MNIPKTANPDEPATVARLASIPHGTTIVAQGTASSAAAGPNIPNIGITPFTINHPDQTDSFPEQTLATASSFRSSGAQLTSITQAMVNDPSAVLLAGPDRTDPAAVLQTVLLNFNGLSWPHVTVGTLRK